MTVRDQNSERGLCLILEDNWLIAAGLADQVSKQGFTQVETLGTCDDALAFLEKIAPARPDLVILDVSIGSNETSLPVAQRLSQSAVPFFIISGHGANNEVTAAFPDAITLQKPVQDGHLAATLDEAFGPQPSMN